MNKLCLSLLALLAISAFNVSRASARAPDSFEEDYHEPLEVDSPMWMSFEIKVGPYRPGRTATFQNVYENDRGWMLNLEADVTLWHIPYVGQLNAGLLWGWSNYDAHAINTATGERAGITSEFTVFPIAALAMLRVDTIARQTVIPLTFAGKLGYELIRWKSEIGGDREASGLNQGLRWGVQGAFELDWFDRGTARRMDEDWGVNHTFLLFEWYQSRTKGTGDSSFTVGLGAQF